MTPAHDRLTDWDEDWAPVIVSGPDKAVVYLDTKYSEDEPRDDHGQWTDGGGSSADAGAPAPRQFDSEQGYQWHEEGPVKDWADALPRDDREALQSYAGFGYSDINNTLRGDPPMKTVTVRPMTTDERDAVIAAGDQHPIVPPEGEGHWYTLDWNGTPGGWVVQTRVVDEERAAKVRASADKLDAVIRDKGYVLPEAIQVNRAAYLPGVSEAAVHDMVGHDFHEPAFTSTMVGTAGGRLEGYAAWGKFESIYKRYEGQPIAAHQDEVGSAITFHINLPKGTTVAPIEAVRQAIVRGYSSSQINGPMKDHRTESEVLLGSGAKYRITGVKDGGVYKGSDPTLKPVHLLDVTMDYTGGGSSARRKAAARRPAHDRVVSAPMGQPDPRERFVWFGWARDRKGRFAPKPLPVVDAAPPLKRADLATKYSDDEPRDDHGRWTDGGGSDGPPHGVLESMGRPDGGFTYHAATASVPTTGYALSLHKDRERVLPAAEANLVALTQFTRDNWDLLSQPTNYLGGWHNPGDGKVYLDVSTVVNSAAEAEHLGREHGQLAYFDLAAGNSVEIHPHGKQAHAPFDRPARRPADDRGSRGAGRIPHGAQADPGGDRGGTPDLRRATEGLTKYSDDEPRDDHGRWTDGGGGADGGASDHPAHADATYLASPHTAYREIEAGHPTTIAKEDLRALLEYAAKQDTNADLTKLTLEGTPIFAGGFNRDRGSMPQISGKNTDEFLNDMREEGITTHAERVAPMTLLPSQNEIGAREVGQGLAKFEAGQIKTPRAILISKDNRVLDGHHRWAVSVALQTENPKVRMNVIRLGLDAKPALDRMLAWAHAHGEAPKTRSVIDLDWAAGTVVYLDTKYSDDEPRDDHGRWTDGGGGADSGTADAHHGPTSGDAAKYAVLKTQWSKVNDELLGLVDTPDSPEARAKLDQLKAICKEMQQLNVDPGGIEGVGLPGGPRDLVIVGAGPGGLSAAVMGGTDGLDTLFVDANTVPGGQSKWSSRIENFPGFPVGVTGETLARNLTSQAERVGAEGKLGVKVTGLSIDPQTGLKTLTLSNGETVEARAVVIAGGLEARQLDFPGEASQTVTYLDSKRLAADSAGKAAVVIGGSNGAAQAALGAAKVADSVTVISRSPIEKGMSHYQVEALHNNPKITVVEGDEIKAFDPASHTVTLKSGGRVPGDAVGVFAGSLPNTSWLPAGLARQTVGPEAGKIHVNQNLETNIPGVFAIGDVRVGSIGRIGGAVGDGQLAERNAFLYFEKLGKKAAATRTHPPATVATYRDEWAQYLDQLFALDKLHPWLSQTVEPTPLPAKGVVYLDTKYSDDEPRDDHGQWTDGGGSATGSASSGDLAAWEGEGGSIGQPADTLQLQGQAAVGIDAIAQLEGQALADADFTSPEAQSWDTVDSAKQDEAERQYVDEQLQGDIEADVDVDEYIDQGDLQRDAKDSLSEALAKNPDPVLAEFDTSYVDHMYADGSVDLADDAPDLTPDQRATLDHEAVDAFSAAYDSARESAYESEGYQEAESNARVDVARENWNNLSDADKLQYATDNNVVSGGGDVSRSLPDQWEPLAGLADGGEDAVRTGAMGRALANARTEQLLATRGLLDADGSLPGPIESTSDTIAPAVWDEWKSSSSAPLSNALQLAAAEELGGVHRLSPPEVAAAQSAATAEFGPKGMDVLKAYSRAQWETTQYLLNKAGVDQVETWRGLMMPRDEVEQQPKEDPLRGAGSPAKLPALRLQRNGLQSATLTAQVANQWGGVGVLPGQKYDRVVMRVKTPAVGVFSVPAFGQNVHEEREVVLLGTKGEWKWDAWTPRAPEFHEVPLTKAAPPSSSPKPMVIDMHAHDQGPHWLTPAGGNVPPDRPRPAARRKYTEDEPRDDHGRWTDGGGGSDSGASSGAPSAPPSVATTAPKLAQPGVPAVAHSDEALAAARAAILAKRPVSEVLAALGPTAAPQYDALFQRAQVGQGELSTLLSGLVSDVPGAETHLGPIKGLDRAVEKMVTKDHGDARMLHDPIRATATVAAAAQVPVLVAAIDAKLQATGGRIIEHEDWTHTATPLGYRAVNLKAQLPSGVIGELQVTTRAMLGAKNGDGHTYYEEARSPRTSPERVRELEIASRRLYDAAWATKHLRAAAGGAGYDYLSQDGFVFRRPTGGPAPELATEVWDTAGPGWRLLDRATAIDVYFGGSRFLTPAEVARLIGNAGGKTVSTGIEPGRSGSARARGGSWTRIGNLAGPPGKDAPRVDLDALARRARSLIQTLSPDAIAKLVGDTVDRALAARPLIKGDPGEPGEPGEVGEPGEAGEVGPPGPVGPAGPPGPPGERGLDGRDGRDGADGDDGDDGADGDDGDDGAPGGDGAVGPQGERGDVGPAGPQGECGETGLAGADGDPGPAGPQGERGDVGPTGPQGERGEAGLPGERGDVGPQGERGPQGEAGPMGPPGTSGDAGEEGPAGEAGIAGPVGPMGEKGLQGDPGPQGALGAPGLGFDDLVVQHDGERSFTIAAVRGDQTKALGTFTVPAMIHRGVWRPGASYAHQDVVTWGGSQWVCMQAETTAKPGEASAESRAWVMAVRKGDAGKPGPQGEKGLRGDKGEQGSRGPERW